MIAGVVGLLASIMLAFFIEFLEKNKAALAKPNWFPSPLMEGVVGNVEGGGSPDILSRNYSTGQNAVWFMNDVTLSARVYPPAPLTRTGRL